MSTFTPPAALESIGRPLDPHSQRVAAIAFCYSVLFAIPAIITLLLERNNVRLDIAAGPLLLVATIAFVAALLAVQRRATLGATLLLTGIAFYPLQQVTHLELFPVFAGLLMYGTAVTLSNQLLPARLVFPTMILFAVLEGVVVFIDLTYATERQLPNSAAAVATTVILFTWLLVAGLFVFQNFRMYPMAVKFVSTTLFVALAAIGITTAAVATSISSSLQDEFGASIVQVAASEASDVAVLLTQQVQALETISLNSAVEQEVEFANYGYPDDPLEIAAQLDTYDALWNEAADGDPFVRIRLNNPGSAQLRDFVERFPLHTDLFVTDAFGGLVAATGRTMDFAHARQAWWIAAFNNGAGTVYVGEPFLDAESQTPVLRIAVPMYAANNSVVGILHSAYRLDTLISQLEVAEDLGESGNLDLVVGDRMISVEQSNLQVAPVESLINVAQLLTLEAAQGRYLIDDFGGENSFIGAAKVSSNNVVPAVDALEWLVIANEAERSVLAVVTEQQRANILVGLLVLVTGGFAAVIVANAIARPLRTLSALAIRVSEGELGVRAAIEGDDEIAELSAAFNEMTGRLQETLDTLENRVRDRTLSLSRAAEIGRLVGTVTDVNLLPQAVADQIQALFGYYHVHVYLPDPQTGLVMAGGSGRMGKRLVERKHRLPAGAGLVGAAFAQNIPILVGNVAADPRWISNPLLPDTKAELALPIAVGNTVLGVLDIQSDTEDGLTVDDISRLTPVTAQVAVTMQNAQLLKSAEQQAEQERLINQITQRVQDTTDIAGALAVAAEELGRALGVRDLRVSLKRLDNGEHRVEAGGKQTS